MTNKQLTIPEAVRALTVGDCPTRREAVKIIREYFENGDPVDKIRAEIVDLADSDAYGDYQQGFNFGLMRAAQIIDKCKAESEEE